MTSVNLYYLSPNTTGGWVTYTAHLMAALRAAGMRPTLRKIGNKTETKSRPFGYSEQYTNTSLETAFRLADRGSVDLIVAAAKNLREATEGLLARGARIIIHDPTEFNNVDATLIDPKRCVVIRKVGLDHVPGATFIRHPYKRRPEKEDAVKKTIKAVATSRIDFDKNTTMILDANRLLLAAGHEAVRIYGFENRLYTKFKVCPHYPEWEQSKCAYPREAKAAYDLLAPAEYLVDMSVIKEDGGGTQYTTLEAWDAGACPVIHEGWLRDDDDMVAGQNCAAANSGMDLAGFLSGALTEPQRFRLVLDGQLQLQDHAPEVIGPLYAKFLGV